MPLEKERSWGKLIWSVAADLTLDTVTTATAGLFFQRFCLAEREGDFDHHRLAMASLWLASKVRETSCRLRDIVNGFEIFLERADEKGMPMEVYWAMRDEIVLHEQVLLRGMGFDVELTPAYAYLGEFAWMLGSTESGVLQLAWTLLNDAFRCELCAMASPDRLALGCLLLAVELSRRVPQLQLQANDLSQRLDRLLREPQLEDFLGLGRGGEEIEDICRDLLAMYEEESDKGTVPTGAVDLQQAFVRMGGSRHACHMMMLRLHDEKLVAQVIRLLAASVENAPLAAEALMRDNLDNVKLVMRSMERHLGCPEVSEAGCLLIGHLCSCTSTKTGNLMPVRVKAHRDSQNALCREGAVEIIVDVMTLYMKEVRMMTNKAHMLMQEKLKEAESQSGSSVEDSDERNGPVANSVLVDPDKTLEEAEIEDGECLTALVFQPQLAATGGAFALWCHGDSAVVTWGDTAYSGDISAVRDQLRGVRQILATGYAFAAILEDGSVVTWGQAGRGGDSSAVRDQLKGVEQIQATENAFAAILEDGSVVTWGEAECGGDSSAVPDHLRRVQQIQATDSAFAAILEDGSVVTWGQAGRGGDSSAGVQQIQATRTAFAAILEDGSVVTWGQAGRGGDKLSWSHLLLAQKKSGVFLAAELCSLGLVDMKVRVMTLSGKSMEGSFETTDALRDLALWIRSEIGIPVAVQLLVTDAEVVKDASLQLGTCGCCCTRMLLHTFPDEDEVHVTVLRRPYTLKEREELFQRLVRATLAAETLQARELMKEGAPVSIWRRWVQTHP
eukprot:symbB.v1.2.033930.t1/scaffold4288.1/size41896/1